MLRVLRAFQVHLESGPRMVSQVDLQQMVCREEEADRVGRDLQEYLEPLASPDRKVIEGKPSREKLVLTETTEWLACQA